LITLFIILSGRESMYVCICRAVTEERVRAAIEGGAETVSAVTTQCCAGDDCGACHGVIEEMIEEHQERKEEKGGVRRLPVLPPGVAA
jgi:bacterioferritin-associated ferredoxin